MTYKVPKFIIFVADQLFYTRTSENRNNNIVFQTKSYLSIGITFPKFLLKILPGDKETIEKRGGISIVKTLDKDLVQSMEAFEKAYLNKF